MRIGIEGPAVKRLAAILLAMRTTYTGRTAGGARPVYNHTQRSRPQFDHLIIAITIQIFIILIACILLFPCSKKVLKTTRKWPIIQNNRIGSRYAEILRSVLRIDA